MKPLWICELNNLWRLLKLHMNICEKYSFSLYKQLNDAAKTLINSKASTNRYLHVLCIDLWLQQIINSFFKAFISLNICCGNINIPMQYMYFCFHLIIQTYSFCKKKKWRIHQTSKWKYSNFYQSFVKHQTFLL